MGRLKVRDVMTDQVITVLDSVPIREAARLMFIEGVSGLPVVDERQHLVGILTEADVLTKQGRPEEGRGLIARWMHPNRNSGTSAAKADAWLVREAMTSPVTTVRPNTELRAAARTLARTGVKRLPVVEDGRLVGIVSRHDVIGVFNRSDEDLAGSVRSFLASCGYVEPEADLKVYAEGGVVFLGGAVEHPSDIRVAGNLALSVDGVVDVLNHLRARGPEPAMRHVDLQRARSDGR